MKHILLGKHPSIKKIRELITMVSDTAFNVLILGETGTGKEVVARLLHYASPRCKKRFVKVNCAALPKTLLESELFGYEKGAFTGADKSKPGKFELASDGVIFLDEIGDMPLVLQAKMLQVLQSGDFNRLGGTEDVKVNSWVIAATHHDLEKDMKIGLFREDLYYRLNIIKIELPPLSERKKDIPLLTDHFIQEYRRDLEIGEHFKLNGDLQKLFQLYHWPGNVRELSSTILRLMVGDEPEKIRLELLANMEEDGLSPSPKLFFGPSEMTKKAKRESKDPDITKSLKDLKAESTKYIEKKVILHALEMTGWNKRQTAQMLKISYKTLFYKIDKLGMERGGI
jgi:two-component system, NtrC family, response regulator AtoC